MGLTHQKHLFDIPEDVTYLNIAAQSPAFKAIYEAGLEGLQQKNRPYTITLSDYFEPVIQLKKLFATLIDADDYNRVATIPSVSYGMATVANNIKLQPGDEIVVIDEQFPSNYYSWKALSETYDATIKTVVKPSKTDSKSWDDAIIEAITDQTAVVAMGNLHWSNGSLFNLKAISQKAKQHHALLIIDGSQSVGALPFSIKDIQPDALICAGYKWLFGPYGCAYAYYGSYFDNGKPIEHNWANRLDSENFAGLTNYQSQFKPLANRYQVGESGNFIYVKMQIAALQQIIEWTPNTIQEYCKTISVNAVKELKALGCHIQDDNDRSHHLFGIELPEGLNVEAFKQDLANRQIYVSFRGRYIRVSCHLFNTEADFKPLIACLSAHLQQV
ncbi:aminotransferase class V-fold PLP-dependent enzyme [Olleya aquimaris]|uniref:Selenocysteine lyase/cysteine desulfurase n=1 Tax=Olleya aquimaris TaxID=639310 RepID=A0A327RK29_9FLAO|nr:aminotransferase class V-fold PLP-dependent enzyme [Olleya aquimaris]RAJ16352.1 selenocysteine lyase/cysteine desulfurase [Olleya aquimaris]